MLILMGIVPALFLAVWLLTIRMPGRAFSGPLPPLTPGQEALTERLRRHVRRLAGDIGERNVAKPAAPIGEASITSGVVLSSVPGLMS
jgi:hypothetical protein